jgi:hypothetical protein
MDIIHGMKTSNHPRPYPEKLNFRPVVPKSSLQLWSEKNNFPPYTGIPTVNQKPPNPLKVSSELPRPCTPITHAVPGIKNPALFPDKASHLSATEQTSHIPIIDDALHLFNTLAGIFGCAPKSNDHPIDFFVL